MSNLPESTLSIQEQLSPVARIDAIFEGARAIQDQAEADYAVLCCEATENQAEWQTMTSDPEFQSEMRRVQLATALSDLAKTDGWGTCEKIINQTFKSYCDDIHARIQNKGLDALLKALA